MRRLAASLLVCLGLGATALTAFGEVRTTVSRKQGEALKWRSNSVTWEDISEGEELREGTIIEVGDGAKLGLLLENSAGWGEGQGTEMSITISRPTVFRVGSDILRQIRVEQRIIDVDAAEKLGSIGTRIFSGRETAGVQLQAAWDRTVATFVGEKVVTKGAQLPTYMRPGGGAAMSAEVKARKVKLYAPRDGGTISVDPTSPSVNVIWEKDAKKDEEITYQVFLWKEGTRPTEPVARTTAHSMMIPLWTEGGYFLQVATADWNIQTPIIKFNVIFQKGKNIVVHASEAPPSEEGAIPVAVSTKNSNVRSELRLLYPRQDLYTTARHFPVRVSLEWQHGAVGGSEYAYDVIVTSSDGSPPRIVRVGDKLGYELQIAKAGRYEWRVRGRPLIRGGLEVSTLPRVIEILPEHQSSLAALIRRQIEEKRSGALVWDSSASVPRGP
jgi:hypothetical protein